MGALLKPAIFFHRDRRRQLPAGAGRHQKHHTGRGVDERRDCRSPRHRSVQSGHQLLSAVEQLRRVQRRRRRVHVHVRGGTQGGLYHVQPVRGQVPGRGRHERAAGESHRVAGRTPAVPDEEPGPDHRVGRQEENALHAQRAVHRAENEAESENDAGTTGRRQRV